MTIADIKRRNAEAGLHFFDRSTMRFFDSRVLAPIWTGTDGSYFVTSERFNADEPRLYTVRKIDWATGVVDTVGAFQQYRSAPDAYEAAREASLTKEIA